MNSDTLVAITPIQLTEVNVRLEERDFLLKENNILYDRISVSDSINSEIKSEVSKLRITYSQYRLESEAHVKRLIEENEELHYKVDKTKDKSVKMIIGGIIVGVITGILIAR